jgi:hypothetical protein
MGTTAVVHDHNLELLFVCSQIIISKSNRNGKWEINFYRTLFQSVHRYIGFHKGKESTISVFVKVSDKIQW